MKISEALRTATEILRESGIGEPRREAASLLAFALGKDRTFLITRDDYELSETEKTRFQSLLQRRANREPLQYIKGVQEFYGLDFIVTPGVLIPRPETEMIVENAVEILKALENPRFCEVGVGSGCISVAVLYHAKKASAIGLDVSEKALEIAGLNAGKHHVAGRLKLEISDVYEALTGEKFDLIVSNPPYIPQADIEHLQREVRDFEPFEALTDGADGLSIIERIIDGAPRFLKPEGFLLLEIGYTQSEAVESFFAADVWRSVETLPDLQGIPRTVRAQII